MLLGPSALARFCEVLVEFEIALVEILLGLAEFLLVSRYIASHNRRAGSFRITDIGILNFITREG